MNQAYAWCNALVELPTLEPSKWVGMPVMDLFLSHQYAALGEVNAPVIYICYSFIAYRPDAVPDQDDLAQFSQAYSVPGSLATPVVFLVCQEAHYFVVLMDYQQSCCIVYGRQYSAVTTPITTDDWTDWNGPELWRKVAMLFQAPPPALPHRVIAVQWNQVGYLHLCIKRDNNDSIFLLRMAGIVDHKL